MKISQKVWTQENGWKIIRDDQLETPQLVFVFGSREVLLRQDLHQEVTDMYTSSAILFASTAGEIIHDEVLDDSLAVTAISFNLTTIKTSRATIQNPDQSQEVGLHLAKNLPQEGLKHVMVFSDGLMVNGTALVSGLGQGLSADVSITGGLVGDGAAFEKTVVGLNEMPTNGNVIAIGFYGDSLTIGYGSLGGWDPFGPNRTITKSKNNILYELDGQNALALYKEYLGDLAKDLPSSGLLFPLSLEVKTAEGGTVEVVRTVLSVNEEDQSLTFAGDMPEGTKAQLMKANFERLIDGAEQAATMGVSLLANNSPQLAILISCVGRKLVLKERTVEEIEAVRQVIGQETAITGFYSYGEICPTAATSKQCQLHNQTMTITTFREN